MAIKTYKKKSYTKLSNNFTVAEFACKGSGCCSTVKIDSELVEYLQAIRDHFKKPVIINSGYRCPTHNKRIGGTTNSKHTQGTAADIAINGVAPAEVAKYAETLGIKGIGLYETAKDGYFVHIDTRDNKSFWYGQKQVARTTFGGTPPKDEYDLTQFVKDIQKACGAAVDGIAGPKTLAKTVTLSAKHNVRHAAVKAVQKRLKALGYTEIGTIDGVAGAKFASAVIHFQKDNGCVADGVITKKALTWKKLLGLA